VADLLRLLFLVPLGFIAAVLAAALTILGGWYGHQAGAILTDIGATGYVMGVGVWVVLEVGAVAGVPAFIVIVLAELFGWRSLVFYLAVGGALGLLTSQLHGIVWQTGNSQLLLPAAGFVGGFVYWLIAGRLAGIARPPEPASPPTPRPPTSPG
jgi:hypothetical protein